MADYGQQNTRPMVDVTFGMAIIEPIELAIEKPLPDGGWEPDTMVVPANCKWWYRIFDSPDGRIVEVAQGPYEGCRFDVAELMAKAKEVIQRRGLA